MKEQALKDGLLVKKDGEPARFSDGSVYMENNGNLFEMAVNIAKQRMDMEMSKVAPEKQHDVEQIKNNFIPQEAPLNRRLLPCLRQINYQLNLNSNKRRHRRQ